jgi:hypothetical protein
MLVEPSPAPGLKRVFNTDRLSPLVYANDLGHCHLLCEAHFADQVGAEASDHGPRACRRLAFQSFPTKRTN